MTERTYVGVDENGLGPRLGPLIVTAVSARATDEGAPVLSRKPRGGLASRLGDSKRLVSFDDSALGEAWARVLAPARHEAPAGVRADATDPPSLLARLALDSSETLRAPCPSHHEAQCWRSDDEAFVADDVPLRAIRGDLEKLAAKGVRLVRVRVAIVCAKRLNDAVEQGKSRFDVDLHTMERLVADAAEAARGEVIATCGKVGGYDKYGNAFGRFGLHTALVEGRARSEYRVPGVGTIAFVRDAEDANPLVAMASLVGKWARDLLMRRIVRHHRTHVPDLPEASGYHDPVTTRFIEATALVRQREKIADECFLRRAIGNAAAE